MGGWFIFAGVLILALTAAGISVPPKQGAVTDLVSAVGPEHRRRLEAVSGLLCKNAEAELAALIVSSTGRVKISEYAREVMATWKMGGQSRKGILIVVAINDRTLHVIVGDGLKSALSDREVGRIEDKHMIPYFQKKEYGEGLVQGAAALAQAVDPNHAEDYRKASAPVSPVVPVSAESAERGVLRVKLGTLSQPVLIEGEELWWTAGGVEGRGRQIRVSWDGEDTWVDGKKVVLPLTVGSPEPIRMDGAGYRGSLRVVNSSPPLLLNLVDIESYVAGVVNQEIDTRWPEAAVDAQGILIRTYALKRSRERAGELYDVERTVVDQVYGGVAAEDEAGWAMVKRTRGLVLSYEGSLVSGFYHACCGGRTELPSAVWGGVDAPYQQSVVCPYCSEAPRYFWRYPEAGRISGGELGRLLGLSEAVQDVEIVSRTVAGRVAGLRLLAGERFILVNGPDFRDWLGYNRLWSTAFEVEKVEDGFVFRGSGAGHGVGLCQWGARGMALKGYNARNILVFYFPGTKVAAAEKLR